MPGPGPRVAPLAREQWSEEVEKLLAPLAGMGDGRVLNIFGTLAHHPKLLSRWLVFGRHVLGGSELEARERELAILRIGWLCGSDYEFGQHVLIGRRVGLDDADIERITRGPDDPDWSPAERELLRAVDELHADARIGDATWAALAGHRSVPWLLDLIFTVGQYQLVSMALNSLGVERDPGVPGFPAGARRPVSR